MQGLKGSIIIARNSLILVIIISFLAILINFVHPHRIPFVAERPYEIYVPCPDTTGSIKELDKNEFISLSKDSVIIDARSREEYEKWHFEDAINIEYDYLSPICPLKIKEVISMKRKYVIVYGDGEEPDSGKELAKEIATKGLKNVHYLKGGIKELEK